MKINKNMNYTNFTQNVFEILKTNPQFLDTILLFSTFEKIFNLIQIYVFYIIIRFMYTITKDLYFFVCYLFHYLYFLTYLYSVPRDIYYFCKGKERENDNNDNKEKIN